MASSGCSDVRGIEQGVEVGTGEDLAPVAIPKSE